MAKKEELKLDEFELDDDLNFDFNMDDIDGSYSEDSKKPKKRSPVIDVFKGTVGGVGGKFKDPSFLARTMKDSLPKQYGEIFSTVDQTAGDLSSLYDETIREIKPQMARIAKKVDRLVPEERKFFKRLTTKFKDFIGEEFEGIRGPNKEQVTEQNIASALGEVFGAQQENQEEEKARESAERKIRNKIDDKRAISQTTLLSSINDGITRLSDYNGKVTQAYQKKSLELQYRSYFVQAELLETTSKFYDIFQNQNESIVKNTALPDYVKITKSEQFKEQMQKRFYGSIQNSLFGDNKILETATNRLKSQVKRFTSNLSQGLESGMMGLEQYESMNEQMEQMRSMGIGDVSRSAMLGEMGGGALGEWLGGKLSGFLKPKLEKNGEVQKAGYKTANWLNNIPGSIDKLKRSQAYRETDQDTIPGKITRWMLDLLSPSGPDLSLGGGRSYESLDSPSIFTNKTQKSITEIIPGYLSRILREVTAIRTTDPNIPMTVYDYTSDKFTTDKELGNKVASLFKRKIKGSGYDYSVDQALNFFTQGRELPGQDKADLKRFIIRLSGQAMSYDPESIRESAAYKHLTNKGLVDSVFSSKIETGERMEKNQYKLTKRLRGVRERTPDIRGEIEMFVKAGYGEMLAKEGLIKETGDGGYEIDFDKYSKLVEDTTVSSDINVKRNITSINPKDALESIKKTKVYNWFYKLGKGDQSPHMGPMAQDVNANMGEEAAPGGKKLDLITMNGMNMAAIQALQEEQRKQTTGKGSQSVLELIHRDTSALVKMGQATSSIFVGAGKGGTRDLTRSEAFGGALGSVVDFAFKSGQTLFDKILGTAKFGKEHVAEPTIKFLIDRITKNKDKVGDAFASLFKGAGELAGKVFSLGKDVIFDKLPKGWTTLATLGTTVKDQIKEILNGPVDVFIKGNLTEAKLRAGLMKMGYYFDQATGKVIRTMDDIKGPVVDRLGQLVLTAEDVAQGLVDREGKPVETLFAKLVRAGIDAGVTGYGRLKGAVKSFGSMLTSGGGLVGSAKRKLFGESTGGLGSSKVYDILVEIRDILKGTYTGSSGGVGESYEPEEVSEAGNVTTSQPNLAPRYQGGRSLLSGLGKLGGVVTRAKTALGSKVSTKGIRSKISTAGIRGKAAGWKGKALGALGAVGSFFSSSGETENQPIAGPHVGEQMALGSEPEHPTIVKKARRHINKLKASWNDRDGSGLRDGDWRDRLDAMKERTVNRARNISMPDLSPRYKSETNVIDMLMDKAMGLFGLLSGGVSGLFSKAGGLIEGALSLFGIGKAGKLASIFKSALSVGKAPLKALKSAGSVLARVGAPLARGLSAIKNVASVGRVLSAGNAIRNVMLAGSFLTAGAGSTILGAIGTGMAAIAGILSSPVVLGTAAVLATGYGLYKAYKYFTRDDVDIYERIRVYQYGLTNSEADKHHNHEILQLEAYLLDGKVGYDTGTAYLIQRQLNVEEMYSIFSIDKGDTEAASKFVGWFDRRFKPFFLTHLTALMSVNNKVKLTDIKDLTPQERSKYLSMIEFDSGPYSYADSPFKDVEQLNTDKLFAVNTIKNELNKIKLDLTKQGSAKRPEVKKVRVAGFMGPIYKEVPAKIDYTKANKPRVESSQGEDGAIKQAASSVVDSILGSQANKPSKLAVADGAVRDGQGGMQYIKLQPGVDISNLNPELLNNFTAMVQEYGELTGKSIVVTSGYRSRAKQEELYRKDPSSAAAPGRSLHEFGLALDVNSSDLDVLDKMGLMRKYGFTRPVGQEPWHTEPAGLQGAIMSVKEDPSLASKLIASSLFKGGGGLGTLSNAVKGKRDTQYALSLMGIDAPIVKSDKEQVTERINAVTPMRQASNDNQYLTPTTPVSDTGSPYSARPYSQPYMGGSSGYSMGGFQSKTIGYMGGSGGYAGSVDALRQSSNYSKSRYLPDTELPPSSGSGLSMQTPMPAGKEEVKQMISSIAAKQGLDPNMMVTFAGVESNLTPGVKAKSSSATGLFQFTKATWNSQVSKFGRKHGLDPNVTPTNPVANTLMATEFVKSNMQALKSVKPNPSITDLYLAHFLGAGGARRFLKADPNAIGAQVFAKEAAANKGVFYKNGRALTIGQIYNSLSQKLAATAQRYGVNVSPGSMEIEGASNDDGGVPASTSYTGTSGGPSMSSMGFSGDSNGYSDSGLGSSPSIYSQPNLASPVSPSGSPQGQGDGLGALSSGLGSISNTLGESLEVQRQILEVLQNIANSTSPETFNEMKSNLIKTVSQQQTSKAELPRPAVDLSRKSA